MKYDSFSGTPSGSKDRQSLKMATILNFLKFNSSSNLTLDMKIIWQIMLEKLVLTVEMSLMMSQHHFEYCSLDCLTEIVFVFMLRTQRIIIIAFIILQMARENNRK